MKTLVLGATGATGRLVISQLLEKEQQVKVIVRSKEKFLNIIPKQSNLEIFERDIISLTSEDWKSYLEDVTTVISCLGHNVTFKGIYGHPRRLVTDILKNIYQSIKQMNKSERVKYILMNSTGVKNTDLNEQHSNGEKLVIGLLKKVLPPQADNEDAAAFLRNDVTQNNQYMDWVIVRPDGLVDNNSVTEYTEHELPKLSPIFDSGKTSRINVANFMMRLTTEQETWDKWIGQSPVLYNK